MTITVEHEIPYSASRPDECVGDGDFWGRPIFRYHTHRTRTHGRKAPAEKNVAKCVLFDAWLSGEYQRCAECREAIERQKGEDNA